MHWSSGSKSWRHNISVDGLITEDDCMAVSNNAKEIGVTLTDTFFKVRIFGKDNKHVEVRFTDRKLKFNCSKLAQNYEGARFSMVFLNPDYTKVEKQEQFELWQLLWRRKSDEQPNKFWVRSLLNESKMGERNIILVLIHPSYKVLDYLIFSRPMCSCGLFSNANSKVCVLFVAWNHWIGK